MNVNSRIRLISMPIGQSTRFLIKMVDLKTVYDSNTLKLPLAMAHVANIISIGREGYTVTAFLLKIMKSVWRLV